MEEKNQNKERRAVLDRKRLASKLQKIATDWWGKGKKIKMCGCCEEILRFKKLYSLNHLKLYVGLL